MADPKRIRAARKAAQTKLNIKFQNEQMRLLDFQHELELQGYRFTGDALPKTPKKITAGSVRKLQNITPEYILKNATFMDDETGRVVGGITQYKKEPPVLLPPSKTQISKPKKSKRKAKKAKRRARKAAPKRIDITINNFMYILDQIGEARPEECRDLKALLQNEIDTYGKQVIAKQLSNIPPADLKETVNALERYGKQHYVGGLAYQQFYQWITGTIPSFEEVKQMGAVNDAYDDEDIDNEWD